MLLSLCMMRYPQETKKQLLTLFANELNQEQLDAMLLATQRRILAHQGESLSAKEVNHIICASGDGRTGV